MAEKIILVGNLGRDPEMRYTPEGRAVTNINIATNRVWNDANGQQHKVTTWWRASAWGRVAEVINQYFKKGDPIYIEGHMNPDANTGGPRMFSRQDGSQGTTYEMTITGWSFISGAKSNGGGTEQPQSTPGADTESEAPEDIPF